MPLRHKFKKAQKVIAELPDSDRRNLLSICRDIQKAESRLSDAASELLVVCETQCQGLCCRNIEANALIGFVDFIYILTLAPNLKKTISRSLRHEVTLYPANCVFLKDGVGPCIFPQHVRPETCIVSFCMDDSPAGTAIRRVQSQFARLRRFIRLRKPRRIRRFLAKTLHP